MASTEGRRRLHRDGVLAAAEALLDGAGPEALTMTALAADLGLRVSSLYNHVPSLEALRGELQNRAMRDLGSVLRHQAMGKTGEQGLRSLAHAMRAYASAHPGRYGLAMREPFDEEGFAEASMDARAALGAIFRSFGIEDEVSLDVQLSAFAALHGVIVLDNAGFLGGALDADRIFEVTVDMVVDMLRSEGTAERRAG